MSSSESSVPMDRVVAVVTTLQDGRLQLGSGYLITDRLVLTAEHCTRDKITGEPTALLCVIRASDNKKAKVLHLVPDRRLDVAVLQLAPDARWNRNLRPPKFARIDRSGTGVLDDCTGIGFPLFQRDPTQWTRRTAEFHGTIYQTDEWESGHLLMREPLIRLGPVTDPVGKASNAQDGKGPSPWGGLSGALMFYRGSAIGVVVEHHPRQGDNALRAIGFERIAASATIRQYLGLLAPNNLSYVGAQTAKLVSAAENKSGKNSSMPARGANRSRAGHAPSQVIQNQRSAQASRVIIDQKLHWLDKRVGSINVKINNTSGAPIRDAELRWPGLAVNVQLPNPEPIGTIKPGQIISCERTIATLNTSTQTVCLMFRDATNIIWYLWGDGMLREETEALRTLYRSENSP